MLSPSLGLLTKYLLAVLQNEPVQHLSANCEESEDQELCLLCWCVNGEVLKTAYIITNWKFRSGFQQFSSFLSFNLVLFLSDLFLFWVDVLSTGLSFVADYLNKAKCGLDTGLCVKFRKSYFCPRLLSLQTSLLLSASWAHLKAATVFLGVY